MKRVVMEEYGRVYEMPINARQGDVGRLGREDEDAPDWIWVEHADNGLAGWTPKAFLEMGDDDGRAVFRRDYDAAELSVVVGQVVDAGEAISGWTWCLSADGEAGWVPEAKLATSG